MVAQIFLLVFIVCVIGYISKLDDKVKERNKKQIRRRSERYS